MHVLILIGFGLLSLLGCTRESPKTQLTITWNETVKTRTALPFGSQVSGTSSWGRRAPKTAAETDCIAVMVSESSSSGANSCLGASGTEFRFEKVAGLVGRAETLTLEVTSGPARVIRILGFSTWDGQCSALAAVDRLEVSNPRLIYQETRDLAPGAVELSISPNYAGAEIGSCAGPAMPANSNRCNLVAAAPAASFEDGSVLVHLASGANLQKVLSRVSGATVAGSWPALKSYHVTLPVAESAETAAIKFCGDPGVQFVEPVKLSWAPRYYTNTNDLSNSTNVNSIVAVLSTGVDLSHSVFTQSTGIWASGDLGADQDGNGMVGDTNGWNFIANSGTMIDDDNSGTHMAGIVINQSVDITLGTVPTSEIVVMPVKVIDGSGDSDSTRVASGILYAAQNNADVIVMGRSVAAFEEIVRRAMIYASNRGVALVSPGGDATQDVDATPAYPASFAVTNNVVVGAHTAGLGLAAFSNFGLATVDIFAPGVTVFSTIPSGSFASMSGTTRAAAHVGGVIALNKNVANQLSGYQLKNILESTVIVEAAFNGKCTSNGRIDGSGMASAMSGYGSTPYSQPQD